MWKPGSTQQWRNGLTSRWKVLNNRSIFVGSSVGVPHNIEDSSTSSRFPRRAVRTPYFSIFTTPMKLVAVLQVLILLTSVIIPEGQHAVVRGCECRDNCECSEESRQSGTCCCGKQQQDKQPEANSNPGSCCPKNLQTKKKSCCSTNVAATACGKPDSEPQDDSIGCGCKQTVVQILVTLMPRLRPSSTTMNGHPEVIEILSQVSDQILQNVRLPEVPPPKNSASVTKTNFFAA